MSAQIMKVLGVALVVSTLGVPVVAHAVIFEKQLDRGDRNEDVRNVQIILDTLNLYSYPEITGYFGSVTEKAVQLFQSTYNIVHSGTPYTTGYGRVGPRTLSVLNDIYQTTDSVEIAHAATTTAVVSTPHLIRDLSYGFSGEDVRILQQFLNEHGFFVALTGPGSPGNETTFFGLATQQAVIKFQAAYSIENDMLKNIVALDTRNKILEIFEAHKQDNVVMRQKQKNGDNDEDEAVAEAMFSAPENIRVSSITDQSITLTWDTVANAHSYGVRKKEIDSDTDSTLISSLDTHTYIDTNIRPGLTYAYSVIAYYDNGESFESDYIHVVPPFSHNGNSQPFLELSTSTIREGSEVGSTGVFATIKLQGGPHTWSLAQDGGDVWDIDASTGELLLVTTPDFETQPSYTITPRATHSVSGRSVSESFVMTVTDVPSVSEVGTVAEDGATLPLYGSTREAAFYNESLNTTFFAWEAYVDDERQAHVSAYNHTTETFSPIVDSGIPGLTDNDHGVPTILQDPDGYIHLFGGSHYGSQKIQHAVTDAPNDITNWTVETPLTRSASYPKPVLVDDTIYLFSRLDSTGTGRQFQLVLQKTTYLENGSTSWSGVQDIVNLSEDPPTTLNRVYAGNFVAVGDEIWFVGQDGAANDSERENVYFFKYDTTTGNISNYDGSQTIVAADLPVDRVEADTDFLLYEHTGTDKGTDIPVWFLDGNNRAHIFFGKGPNEGPFEVMYMYDTGNGFSTPEAVADVTGRYDVFAPVLLSDNSIQLYYPAPWHDDWRNLDFPVDGEIMLKTRSTDGTWSIGQKIIEGEDHTIGRPVPVFNGHPDARVMFAEMADGNLDSIAGNKKIFIYGQNGFLERPN